MKDYLSITQLAKMRGVTSETLRHYDRIGLLKPDYVDEFTGYRYYSMSQVEIFDTIIDLRNLGIPLMTIAEYMESRNIANTYELLKAKEADLKKEIAEKKQQLAHIRTKTSYLEQIRDEDYDSEEKWFVEEKKERKLVVSKEEIATINDFFYEFTRLRSNLKSEYTVFGTSITGSVIMMDSFMDDKETRLSRYPAVPWELCKTKTVYGEKIVLPEGRYLCCYGRGILQIGNPIIGRIKKYMKSHKLKACGDLYECDTLDLSLTNDEKERAFCVEVPVISC